MDPVILPIIWDCSLDYLGLLLVCALPLSRERGEYSMDVIGYLGFLKCYSLSSDLTKFEGGREEEIWSGSRNWMGESRLSKNEWHAPWAACSVVSLTSLALHLRTVRIHGFHLLEFPSCGVSIGCWASSVGDLEVEREGKARVSWSHEWRQVKGSQVFQKLLRHFDFLL